MVQPKNIYWKGKYPVVGLKIDTTFERTPPEKVARFSEFFVPDISDWVGVMYTMQHTIRPGYAPMKKLLGTAFTVKMPPGDNLMLKKALTLAQPGDVLIVDARGHVSHCCGGGEMMVIAKRRGIAGMVVDGAYRDLSQIQEIDFPIFCKGVHPSTGPKSGPGEIGVPVSCGGVVVHPGDVIVGDEDGVCCVPRSHVDAVITKCAEVPIRESEEDWPDVVAQNVERDAYYLALLEEHGVEIISK